ncbi:hypothetical protein YC2023_117836 [Brassica napus]
MRCNQYQINLLYYLTVTKDENGNENHNYNSFLSFQRRFFTHSTDSVISYVTNHVFETVMSYAKKESLNKDFLALILNELATSDWWGEALRFVWGKGKFHLRGSS